MTLEIVPLQSYFFADRRDQVPGSLESFWRRGCIGWVQRSAGGGGRIFIVAAEKSGWTGHGAQQYEAGCVNAVRNGWTAEEAAGERRGGFGS